MDLLLAATAREVTSCEANARLIAEASDEQLDALDAAATAAALVAQGLAAARAAPLRAVALDLALCALVRLFLNRALSATSQAHVLRPRALAAAAAAGAVPLLALALDWALSVDDARGKFVLLAAGKAAVLLGCLAHTALGALEADAACAEAQRDQMAAQLLPLLARALGYCLAAAPGVMPAAIFASALHNVTSGERGARRDAALLSGCAEPAAALLARALDACEGAGAAAAAPEDPGCLRQALDGTVGLFRNLTAAPALRAREPAALAVAAAGAPAVVPLLVRALSHCSAAPSAAIVTLRNVLFFVPGGRALALAAGLAPAMVRLLSEWEDGEEEGSGSGGGGEEKAEEEEEEEEEEGGLQGVDGHPAASDPCALALAGYLLHMATVDYVGGAPDVAQPRALLLVAPAAVVAALRRWTGRSPEVCYWLAALLTALCEGGNGAREAVVRAGGAHALCAALRAHCARGRHMGLAQFGAATLGNMAMRCCAHGAECPEGCEWEVVELARVAGAAARRAWRGANARGGVLLAELRAPELLRALGAQRQWQRGRAGFPGPCACCRPASELPGLRRSIARALGHLAVWEGDGEEREEGGGAEL